jgi:hypothetical protein
MYADSEEFILTVQNFRTASASERRHLSQHDLRGRMIYKGGQTEGWVEENLQTLFYKAFASEFCNNNVQFCSGLTGPKLWQNLDWQTTGVKVKIFASTTYVIDLPDVARMSQQSNSIMYV